VRGIHRRGDIAKTAMHAPPRVKEGLTGPTRRLLSLEVISDFGPLANTPLNSRLLSRSLLIRPRLKADMERGLAKLMIFEVTVISGSE